MPSSPASITPAVGTGGQVANPVPSTPAPAIGGKNLDAVIDAMTDIQTEADRWVLAECLTVLIPSGSSGFDKIVDRATTDGVAGGFKAATLRQYRDTDVRWPKEKRVDKVSFTAHREAISVDGGVDVAAKMLSDMAKGPGGPGKVSAAAVRKAVSLKNKRPSSRVNRTGPAGGSPGSAPGGGDLADVKAGGQKLIQEITAQMPLTELSEIKAGLGKILQHTERLIAKANQKAQAQAAKGGVTPAKAAPANADAPKAEAKEEVAVGDLRGA